MKRPAITNGGSMRLYQNKSINSALRIPLNRGNKLFSRFSVMSPLTNGVHYKRLPCIRSLLAHSSVSASPTLTCRARSSTHAAMSRTERARKARQEQKAQITQIESNIQLVSCSTSFQPFHVVADGGFEVKDSESTMSCSKGGIPTSGHCNSISRAAGKNSFPFRPRTTHHSHCRTD